MEQPEYRKLKRVPIRRRFLTTVLLATIISIISVSVIGYFSIRWIRISSEQNLTEHLEANLKNIVQEKARAADAKLTHYEKYIELITDYIENLYADEKRAISLGHMFYAPTDTREYMLTRAFAAEDITEEELRDELLFFSNLETIWKPLSKENEDIIATAYTGTRDGLLASYDRYSYLSCTPEGEELIYNFFFSEWYKRGMKEDGVFYTDVYMDSQGRGLTITIGSGFRDSSGETAGVTCIDFDLSAFYEEMFSGDSENGIFSFALDNEDKIISPDSDTLDVQEYTGLTLDEMDALRADPDGIMEIHDSIYVCTQMERVGWTLCTRLPKEAIHSSIIEADNQIQVALIVFISIVAAILLVAVLVVNRSVTAIIYPLELLGRDIKIISDGDLTYRAAVYRNDEIGDITSGMNEMVDRLNFTLNELMSSQQEVDAMSRLATRDTLTGVRNKTAFDRQSQILTEDLKNGDTEFGFAVLDLNNLKLINDNYGHDKGDYAIKKLCKIICDVFMHSPVFRVGGDEFVVILKDEDYQNVQLLARRFRNEIRTVSGDINAKPWERVSAAIGYALYDEKQDDGIESVLTRADHEMYNCKKAMKGL